MTDLPNETNGNDPNDDQSAVQVWHAEISSDQPGHVESCCEAWLDPDEVKRADKFRQRTSRNQHVVGRGMARRLLGHRLQGSVSPTDIRFAEAVYGKPYVTQPEHAKQPFNVAHTDGLVMCGVGTQQHQLVGVDVERLGRRTDPGLAERFFSAPEIEFLNSKTDDCQRRNAFLRIWTLKESYIKAIGTGLQTPLADFAFTEIDSDQPKIRMLNPDLQDEYQWQFFSIEPQPGFIGALAVATLADQQPAQFDLKCFAELIQ